ncbi:MAG: sugar transferase [Bacteroidales bacterium]
MKIKRLSAIYFLLDLFGSAAALIIFYSLMIKTGMAQPVSTTVSLFELAIYSIFWTVLYAMTGFYHVSLKRSRLAELIYSFIVTLFGVMICFLVMIFYEHVIITSIIYPGSLVLLFVLQFTLTYFTRLTVTSTTARKVHKGYWGYNTIIIGSNGKAADILRKIKQEKIPSGNIISGYVYHGQEDSGVLKTQLESLGSTDDLQKIILEKNIEEVIIAIEENEHGILGEIIDKLEYTDITIKAIPSLRDILTGRVRQSSIFGTPLLEIQNKPMSVWQSNIKEIMDYLVAFSLLLIMLPVIIILAVIIKLHDGGRVIYSQERTGKDGRQFRIYKFRSMRENAENDEPLLSGRNDERVTPVGRFMRKHRLDEVPNLVNVLRGEMSLVGPRPERKYFIDQIVRKAPHYRRLHRVKPGITSWGQVKFGYATSVDEMIERMEYDILYIENMSLLIDLKILIYTAITILKGKGV